MDFDDVWETYNITYLITHPNNQWVVTFKATSLLEAQRKARKIQKERCLFAFKLWVMAGDQE